METGETQLPIPIEKPKVVLPKLPFTYQRVENSEEAQYQERRCELEIIFNGGEKSPPKTDEEIIQQVKKEHESSEWFMQDEWREKGQPLEQVEVDINGKKITIYNWNKDTPLTEEHLRQTQRVFGELSAHFPQILDKVLYLLINDQQDPSVWSDNEKYPLNGYALTKHRAIKLYPKAMTLTPHRVTAVSNFEGTLAHELTHLIQDFFVNEWPEKFKNCSDYPEDWERKTTQNGQGEWINKKTGERTPNYQFPLNPNQCITDYAKINGNEDICESMVAYLYDPEKLKAIAPEKFAILAAHDAKIESAPQVFVQRVPQGEIKLPEIKPEIIKYYVEEPENK